MESSICTTVIFTLLLIPEIICARHIAHQHSVHGQHHLTRGSDNHRHMGMTKPKNADGLNKENRRGLKKSKTVQVAGSMLPNCLHACGSCKPCRLVMVSFVCATIQEAETCPMAYKCMCNHKSFPVP